MATHPIVKEVIAQLSQLEGAHGACFATREGKSLYAQSKSSLYSSELMASLAKSILYIGNKILLECGFGKPELMVVEGNQGKVYLKVAAQRGFILAIYASDTLHMGTAVMILNEGIEKINGILQEL